MTGYSKCTAKYIVHTVLLVSPANLLVTNNFAITLQSLVKGLVCARSKENKISFCAISYNIFFSRTKLPQLHVGTCSFQEKV